MFWQKCPKTSEKSEIFNEILKVNEIVDSVYL